MHKRIMGERSLQENKQPCQASWTFCDTHQLKKEPFYFLTSNLSTCDFPAGIVVYATSGKLYACNIYRIIID